MNVLTDEEWGVLKAGLDAVRSRRRRPMKHERQTVEAASEHGIEAEVVIATRGRLRLRAVAPALGGRAELRVGGAVPSVSV